MQRISIAPRPGLVSRLEERGMLYHEGYYTETAAYQFSPGEIERLEKATNELFEMCLKAVQHVIDRKLWKQFMIPEEMEDYITRSWNEDDVSLYGRFDLAYDSRTGDIRLLEFNADTPTALLEAAVIQWDWLQEYRGGGHDQWNSLHDKLVDHFRSSRQFIPGAMHFACVRDSAEDFMTVSYLAECARQAGIEPVVMYMDEVSVNQQFFFVTPSGESISTIFKLYPWEWMFGEEFAKFLRPNYKTTTWIEPPYKAILSNKMLLPLLWELYPAHPLLLEARFLAPGAPFREAGKWVLKPVFGREGANVRIVQDGETTAQTSGEYGAEGFIAQRFFEIPKHDGWLPVLGTWVVAGEAAGMGIREQEGSLITGNLARFAPHFF